MSDQIRITAGRKLSWAGGSRRRAFRDRREDQARQARIVRGVGASFLLVAAGSERPHANFAEPASPVIDAVALDGIRRACRYLRAAVADGSDIVARQNMMTAAFEGVAAIGKGLGLGHAIAISCGDQVLHHGVLSAIGVLATIRFQTIHVPDKIRAVAQAMDLPAAADVEGGLRILMRDVGLPLTLHEAGYHIRNMKALARQCEASPFNRTSPYAPSATDFEEMLASVASS